MYCLEKFQRELAYFLDIDLRDLPKVQEILKAQGYTAVKKNDEIIELGSARQSFLEKIPADIAPSTFTKKEIEKLLTQFDNIENLTQHLNTRADSQARQELFHLLESTKNNPNIHYTKDSKDKYLKRFKDNDEHDPYFYLLITKDKDKTFITHLKTRDLNYLEKEILNAESIIKGADIIGDFRQQAGSAKHKSPTSTIDSTTNNLKWQQDGNVLRSVVELDNGEKLLLSKDRLENVYIQSNHIEQVNSYDELILQESLEKFAKDEIENKLARQIESISQFGENYPQFYHKAHEAIQHLLHTKSGQVQGAFHRKELGDIDLVWGNEKIGLQKIVDKHLNDFTDFKGNNPYEKMSNAINEIVENGKLLTENGVNTLYLQKDNKTFLVGLSKGWHNKGDNQWIITSYEAKNLKADMLEKIGANKTISADESLNALQTFNATDKDIIPQKSNKAGIAKLDSAQIQSQMEKEAQAQQEMAEYFAQAQAKKDEMIALKEARLGKNADEVPLHKGQDIPYKPLRDTSIVLSDELPPFEAEFAVVRLSDIKPNFDNSNTQGRLIKQESVIANIVNDFKPELMFYQEGGVNGVPIITRDGKVVSGNHRSEALKQIIDSHNNATQAAREQYKKSAKEFLGVDLQDNEIIVRRLKENMSDKQILQLAFSSNIGRESTMGEKALSTLSLYRQNIATLPKLLQSENVNELKSLVAKHIDKQGNGLNTFDTNLALLTSLAKNGKNSNILQSLDSIKGNSEYKNKIINMYVDNAGSFYNLAHNPSFKNLEFRDILSDSIYYTAKQNPTRQLDYEYLIQEIESFLNLAKDKEALKNALVLDSNKVQNLTAQAFGLALAKFSRQENPSSALYEALKQAPKALELATQPTFFTQGKALSEVDIYDFLEYLINQGQITQSQSVLSSLMPRLRELRESIANPQSSVSKVESTPQKAPLSDISFTDSNGKTYSIPKDTADLWLKTFNLKSLDEAYTPKFSDEVSKALEPILQGEQIKLTSGSLLKLMQRDRLEFLPYIKENLEHSDVVIRDKENAIIFVKDIGETSYFTSVSKNNNGEWIISTNSYKTINQLKNRVNDNGEILYISKEAPNILAEAFTTKAFSNELANDIIPQNPTKAQSEYFNSLTNEYEKIKEIKKLHTQDDVLVRVMKINDRYIEPLSNMGVSKEYLQKQTAQSLKENITQAILGNQTQLKALQQGYNTYHLSPFQKEVLESALDIANNPAKLKEYKLQGLQKQLDNLNSNEAYHIEKGREYDKARYAKDREELEKEIYERNRI